MPSIDWLQFMNLEKEVNESSDLCSNNDGFNGGDESKISIAA